MKHHSSRLRLGVIGLGLIAQSRHLPNLVHLRDTFDIRAVCDLSATVAEHIAASIGEQTEWTTRYEEILENPHVDAILICTPGAHSTVAREALEQGKHVLAEKPYAYASAVAEEDAAFAAERGLVLQVGYMKMYEPAVEVAREALDEIGPIRLARITVLHPSDENQTVGIPLLRGQDVSPEALIRVQRADAAELSAALAGRSTNDSTLVRNVLFGSVCHDAALLRALFPDETASVLQAVPDAPAAERTEPPRLQITGALSGGAKWTLSWNWLADFPEYQEWVEIYGDRGSIRIDLPAPYGGSPTAAVTVTTRGENSVLERRLTPEGPDSFERELREFALSVQKGKPIRSTAHGAAQDSELLLGVADLLAER